MTKPKVKVGDIIEVRFFDHTQDWGGVADVTVWGRLVEDEEVYYKVDSWAPTDPSSPRKKKWHDRTEFCIVKGAVLSVRRVE